MIKHSHNAVNKQGHIVNGHDAKPLDYPFMCSLQLYFWIPDVRFHWCGSTLLNEYWALTSAHCIFQPIFPPLYEILCGRWNHAVDEPYGQKRSAQNIIPHAKFEMGQNFGNARYDIAVLRVSEPFEYTIAVKPIKLPEPEFIPSGYAMIIGWGVYQEDPREIQPDILQELEVPIIPVEECIAFYYPEQVSLFNTTICAGSVNDGGVCSGDSGGPIIQHDDDGDWVQYGVTYWTRPPCGSSFSGHVGVSFLLDWINENIN